MFSVAQAFRSSTGLIRYYQAAIVNTLFGYSLFALLIAIGLNIYLAQLVSHTLGVIFNYFTYSRHAFHGIQGSKLRFALAYVVNYLVGLAMLALASTMFSSPYVIGLVAVILASLINYFILKNLVFIKAAPELRP